jgi:DNA primase small subunit
MQWGLCHKWGFKDVLCVFSGRRGIHLWVKDSDASKFCTATRRRLLKHLGKAFVESRAELKDVFETYVYPMIQQFVKDQQYQTVPTHQGFHLQIELTEGDSTRVSDGLWKDMMKRLVPKIDESVTISTNHLLKLPFSVHPETDTKCISIPIPWDSIETFDPLQAPTLDTVSASHVLFQQGVQEWKRWSCPQGVFPEVSHRGSSQKFPTGGLPRRGSLEKNQQTR